MQPSMFNVQVPLPERNEVFLMNTFSDAQLLVSPDVTELLDRVSRGERRSAPTSAKRSSRSSRTASSSKAASEERRRSDEYFSDMREDTDQMRSRC